MRGRQLSEAEPRTNRVASQLPVVSIFVSLAVVVVVAGAKGGAGAEGLCMSFGMERISRCVTIFEEHKMMIMWWWKRSSREKHKAQEE